MNLIKENQKLKARIEELKMVNDTVHADRYRILHIYEKMLNELRDETDAVIAQNDSLRRSNAALKARRK